jgi:hypothetical protein
MFKQDDLIDAIMESLSNGTPSTSPGTRSPAPPVRRLFLSEYDVRRRLTANPGDLRIPKGAIVSPLALDWLSLKGIRIVEE